MGNHESSEPESYKRQIMKAAIERLSAEAIKQRNAESIGDETDAMSKADRAELRWLYATDRTGSEIVYVIDRSQAS